MARGASQHGTVEREVRLTGGRRTRVPIAMPHLTVLVHGPGAQGALRRARDLAPHVTARAADDAAGALRAEMRVRGDRYLMIASASSLPDRAGFAALAGALESAPFVALAAPDAGSLDGRCVVISLARFPQHVVAAGATLADAIGTLVASARVLRRAVRARGFANEAAPPRTRRSATIVVLASSAPEVLRVTLSAAIEASHPGDELVAACAAGAVTARRTVAAYGNVRIEDDAVDPLLAGALNRALGTAHGDLVAVLAGDVLLPAGALDRMRDAFAQIPSLGAAFPAVPGASGGEGVVDVQYADIAEMRTAAEARAHERGRELEPIDLAVTPAFVAAREALDAVGGIDPRYGPTRRGIADLVLRLRAAGYGVVRCDAALAHRFDPAQSQCAAATADAQQPVPAADPAAIARGFDPARRVPFVSATPLAASDAIAPAYAIAVPAADAAELERAAGFLAAAARAYDARSPVRVHVLLDGTLTPAEAVARIRAVLAASGKPMEATLAVRVERVADLLAWRAALEPGVSLCAFACDARAALHNARPVDARTLPLLTPAIAR
jgi:hypothetical protein